MRPGPDTGLTGDAVRVARLPVTSDRNPYQRLLYDATARAGAHLVTDGSLDPRWLLRHRHDVDVIHVHWCLERLLFPERAPDECLPAATDSDYQERIARIERSLDLAGALGYGIVWTVHEPARLVNALDPFSARLAQVLAPRANSLIVLDHAAAEVVQAELGRGAHVVPIGPVPVGTGSRARGRALLGIGHDEVILLAFGHQRVEKDLHHLVSAFTALGRPDCVLVIAGRFESEGLATAVRLRCEDDPRIRLLAHHVDDRILPDILAAADAAVLARRHPWTPSSAVHALSASLPVVCADLPGNREHLGSGAWYFEPERAAALVGAMAEVATTPAEGRRARGRAGRNHVHRHTWTAIGQETAALLRASTSTHAVAAPRP